VNRLPILAAATLTALVAVAAASAHARVSPAVSLSKQLQLYSLAVPTEKSGVTTTEVVLDVPDGFSIDSFVASPGWHRVLRQTGSGEDAVIQQVTWKGGSTPTGEDSLFQFLGEAASSGTYTFHVVQTYSDGSVVDWNGAESSEDPAPAIVTRSSLGGGSTPLLAIVALVVGAVGVLLALVALVSRGGNRALA
jgi:uncharacterized protein YcnI